MSPHENRNVVRAVYQAYNARDFATAARLCSERLELKNEATGDAYRGRAGYLQYVRGWEAAFPDGRIEIAHLGGGGSTFVVEYVARGTHTGTLVSSNGHIPPTWTQVVLRFCDVVELEDGKITRVSSYFDSASLLRQLGLLPHSPLHGPDRRASLDLYALEVDASAQQRGKALVQRFVDSVLNQRNPSAAAELCLPNLAWHGGPLGELRDLGSYQHLLASLFASFPDLEIAVEDLIAENDRVAARLTLRGTHLGDFQGIPPTGKRVSGSGASTFRVVNGRIAEAWWQHDLFTFMKQMDVLPAMVRLSSAPDA